MNRSGDGVSSPFTGGELAVLADGGHYARLMGFDGHGFSIATSPLPGLRAGGLTTPTACFLTGSLEELPRGPWHWELDDHEEAFLHSADPASAAMFRDDAGAVVLAFRQDVRLLPHHFEVPDMRAKINARLAKPITGYVVRRAEAPDGPFDTVVATLPVRETSSPVAIYQPVVQPAPAVEETAWYRVSSRYADGREVPYSWPVRYWAEGGNLGGSSFYAAVVYRTTTSRVTFSATCATGGAVGDCPDNTGVGVVVDFNRDAVFEPGRRCVQDANGALTGGYCEALAFTTREAVAGGYRYAVTLDVAPNHHWDLISSYRVVDLNTHRTLAPWATIHGPDGPRVVEASFDIANFSGSPFMGVNNRIEASVWGGLLVDRSSEPWLASIRRRLDTCAAQGYDGVFVDFLWDYLDRSWFRTSALPVGYDPARYARSGVDLLAAIRDAKPDFHIAFNGVTVDRSAASTDAKLAVADLAYHEFFYSAPDGRKSLSQVSRDLAAALTRTAAGHEILLGVGLPSDETAADVWERVRRTIGNGADRVSSFALYLLVANPHMEYWTDVEVGGPYMWLHLFPEWKVPLGAALVPQPAAMRDLTGPYPAGVYRRTYENGIVVANLGCAAPCAVDLGGAMYRLATTGGWDPALGELPGAPVTLADGAVHYSSVSSLRLAPGEGVILLDRLPDSAAFGTPTATPAHTRAVTPSAPPAATTPSVLLPALRRGR
ncbi:MAG: hypothetical protein IT332_14540 [Ardenticatenales bacterium]|nr:hypothetical protein [Ardenticatenales bacterium]